MICVFWAENVITCTVMFAAFPGGLLFDDSDLDLDHTGGSFGGEHVLRFTEGATDQQTVVVQQLPEWFALLT